MSEQAFLDRAVEVIGARAIGGETCWRVVKLVRRAVIGQFPAGEFAQRVERELVA
jgi:hypothetical protein